MVKQTKKGSIGKKALSAILAASMIMTSSSFVMAAPVVEEVEAVAVEESVAAEVVEDVDVEEENAKDTKYTVAAIDDQEYTGKEQKPQITVNDDLGAPVDPTKYTVLYSNNINVGTAKVTIRIEGENDPIETEFKITAKDISSAVISIPDIKYVYNGKEQRPAIQKVVIKGATPEDDITVPEDAYEVVVDESVDYVNAGVGKKLTIKAKENGNFTGTATVDYDIQQATMKASDVKISVKDIPYGTALTASNVTVTEVSTGKALTTGFDVKVKDASGNLVAPDAEANNGSHTFYVVTNGLDNYVDGTAIEATYNVVTPSLQTKIDSVDLGLAGFDKIGDVYQIPYDGTDKWPTIETIDTGIVVDKQFKIVTQKAEWKDAGKYSIELEGINDYDKAKATIDFEILPVKLADSDVTATYSTTNSQTETPATVAVQVKGNDLKEGIDYTYTEGANHKVTVIGKGNYAGTVTVTATYTKMSVANDVITASVAGTYNYTGSQIEVKAKDITVTEGGSTPYTLVYGKDYVIDGVVFRDENDVVKIDGHAGENVITLNGAGNYTGTREVKVNVVGTDFNDIAVIDKTALKDLPYAGTDLKDDIEALVKVLYKETGAVYESTKYDIAIYAEGEDEPATTVEAVGTYRIVVTPVKGQYSGKLEAEIKVIGKDLKDATIADVDDQKYTGEPVQPKLVVNYPQVTTPLVEGKDYKVEYVNNVKSGVAIATVIGMGEYSGKKSITFNIVGQMDQKIAVLPAQEKALKTRTLNDKATKVKYTTAPETEVTYASSDDKVVTVDAEGNIKYTGLGTATITITAAESEEYKAATVELEVTVGLKQPTFSPSSKNNAFTVTTSTVKGAEKFQVQYVPTGKSFTSSAAKTKTFTVDKKLIKGRISAANKETYRVRVRAISGTTKSKWSPVKTIATK